VILSRLCLIMLIHYDYYNHNHKHCQEGRKKNPGNDSGGIIVTDEARAHIRIPKGKKHETRIRFAGNILWLHRGYKKSV